MIDRDPWTFKLIYLLEIALKLRVGIMGNKEFYLLSASMKSNAPQRKKKWRCYKHNI